MSRAGRTAASGASRGDAPDSRHLHDGLKQPHQGLLEVVLQIVLGVDREVLLEHEDWVLGLLERLCPLGPLDDDVSDAVAHLGCCRRGTQGMTITYMMIRW